MMNFLRRASSLVVIGLWLLSAAQADIVVIVSNTSGISSLSKDDVERIFLGKLSTFPNNTIAIPLDNIEGLKTTFYEKIANKSKAQLSAYWSKMVFTSGGQPPKTIGSDTEIIDLVAKNPNIVAYIDRSHLTAAVHVVFTVP